jgi:hypothetical protein
MPSFRRWLLHQQSRRDPVGDLARDTAQDVRDGFRRWDSVVALRGRMKKLGACDGALEALARAQREWKREA